MKMYVGNLPFKTTSDELQELFSNHGEVTDIYMPTDRDSGRPRGFAFVTMSSKEEMEAAIKALDGEELEGRALRINEAQPREDRGGGNRGGYGGGRGGNDRRGGDRRGGDRW